jgi:hypothetical protein
MNADDRSVAETPDPSRAALRLQRRSLTARGALRFIAAFTLLTTGDVARELEHIGARLSAIESLLHQSDAPVPHADPETPAPAREARRRGERS